MELMQRPEIVVICGVLVVVIMMLVAIMLNMNRREREQNRWFSDVEHAIYDSLSGNLDGGDDLVSASDGRLEREQAVREEVTRQLNGLRADVARETAQAVGAQVSTALDGLSDELARLNSRLDEWQGATGELRLLCERLSVAPRGEMPLGQLDALLMQWFAPGRYVRDFEVGTGSGRYADVAILLPDEAGRVLYLPVDMSFPVEEFSGEWNAETRARLSQRLAEHAARLAAELIKPGLTTDFVIMLLRSELVSARVGELDTALASAQLARQVIPVGPATFWSIARALDGGASALEMRRSTRQLERLMQDMRGELGRFTHILDAGSAQPTDYQPRRRRGTGGADLAGTDVTHTAGTVGEPGSGAGVDAAHVGAITGADAGDGLGHTGAVPAGVGAAPSYGAATAGISAGDGDHASGSEYADVAREPGHAPERAVELEQGGATGQAGSAGQFNTLGQTIATTQADVTGQSGASSQTAATAPAGGTGQSGASSQIAAPAPAGGTDQSGASSQIAAPAPAGDTGQSGASSQTAATAQAIGTDQGGASSKTAATAQAIGTDQDYASEHDGPSESDSAAQAGKTAESSRTQTAMRDSGVTQARSARYAALESEVDIWS